MEEHFKVPLKKYKRVIDEQMITIMGQVCFCLRALVLMFCSLRSPARGLYCSSQIFLFVPLFQMEPSSKIFDYLYLGTEWNASNWEELEANNCRFILNVTREIPNFFPQHIQYYNVR